MKNYILTILMAVVLLAGYQTIAAEDSTPKTDKQTNNTEKRQTVVLTCDLHCQGCCDKVMKNIAFEKGVKDLVCDLKTKTVTVTFDPRKTDIETLLAAFERIGKPAQVKK